MKTYEDLEREAYIRGDIALANLYSKAIELDEALEELDDEGHSRYEIDRLEDEISDLEADLEYYRERAIRAEAALEEIELQNEEFQQKD
jgi:DNA repair exonuclease SbcCD ATPase subunit